MTDGQLVALVEETPPDELSAEQIALLRRRLPHSSELREALAEQLRLEQTLNAALGTPQVSIDWIIAQAAAGSAATGGIGRLFGWGPATAVVIAIATVGVVIERPWAVAPNAAPVPQVAAAVEELDAAPADKPPPPLADLDRDALDRAGAETEQALEANAASPSDTEASTAPLPDATLLAMSTPATKSSPNAAPGALQREQRPTIDAAFFQEVAWDGFDEIERMLEPIEGAHERLMGGEAQPPAIKLAAISQLNEAWPENAAIRLRLGESANFRLHLWKGAQGITIERSMLPRPCWAVYRATRRANDARPQSLALWAVDGDRYRRTGQRSVDLRWQRGELVLSRGDVPLAVVPCAARPEAVFFEGPSELSGLAIVAGDPLPLNAPGADDLPPPTTPADLTWASHLPPGAQWNALAAGRGELLAEDTAELSWVATRIADPGLHELVLQLEDPLPGTGIYLGDEAGRPLYQLGFFRDELSGQTCFGFLAPGDSRMEHEFNPGQGPIPYAGVRPWLKLTLAGGRLRCWTSGDGRHWSPAIEPLGRVNTGDVNAGYKTTGLYALPGGGTRCLRIRHFEARELKTLTALAPARLREQVSSLVDSLAMGDWHDAVAQSCPPDVDSHQWRLACAVELLASGSRPDLTAPVLIDVLEATLSDAALTPDERLALLDEAATIFDATEPGRLQAFLACYERLGHALAREGNRQAWSLVRAALLTSPLATAMTFDAQPPSLISTELAELAAEGDEPAIRALGARVQFYCGRAAEHVEVRRLTEEAIERLSADPKPGMAPEKSPPPPGKD